MKKFIDFYQEGLEGGKERYKASRKSRSFKSKVLKGDFPDIKAFIKGLVSGSFEQELKKTKAAFAKATDEKTKAKLKAKFEKLTKKVQISKKIKVLNDKLTKTTDKAKKQELKSKIAKLYKSYK